MARQHLDAPANTACIWASDTATIEELAQRISCWAGHPYTQQIVYSTSPTPHIEVPKDLCILVGEPLTFLDGGTSYCPLTDDTFIDVADPLDADTCLPPGSGNVTELAGRVLVAEGDIDALQLEDMGLTATDAAYGARLGALEAFQATAGEADGLATLDGTGNVPLSQLGNVPGGSAAVTSVNTQTGDVVLDAADVGAAATSHGHAQSDVTNLVTDLAGKAAASHTHAQSDVTGLTSSLAGKASTVHTHVQSDITGLTTDLAAKAADSAVVHKTGTETIGGVKTFTSLPTIPVTPVDPTDAASKGYVDSLPMAVTSVNTQTGDVVLDAADVGAATTSHSHAQSDVTGLVTDLAAKSAVGHTHAQSAITNLTADLAAKANDSTVVHNTGAESIAGAKTFSDGLGSTVLNGSNVTTGTVPDANIASTIARDSEVVLLTGAQTVAGAKTFSDGLGSTALNGSNVSSGTVPTAQLGNAVTITGNQASIAGNKTFTGQVVAAGKIVVCNEGGINNLLTTLDTTSSSYVDLPGTSSFSFTKQYGSSVTKLRVFLTFGFRTNGVFTAAVAGVRINSVDTDVASLEAGATDTHYSVSGMAFVTGLGAGTYTVQGRVRRYAGSGTVQIDSNDRLSLFVAEVPV